MKEFVTAVEEVRADEEREAKIAALVEAGKTRAEAEQEVDPYIEFSLDGRVYHSYPPLDGQLAFMLASLGRGQTQEGRFSAILNIMLSTMREEDADVLEARLLTRGKNRVPMKTLEGIFEYLMGEWFGGGEDSERPTLPSSGSA